MKRFESSLSADTSDFRPSLEGFASYLQMSLRYGVRWPAPPGAALLTFMQCFS